MTKNEINGLLAEMDIETLFDVYYAAEKKIAEKTYNKQVIVNEPCSCPRCKSIKIKKNGHNKNTGKQMYKCKECNKQFAQTVNTLMHSTKKDASAWMKAIECVLNRDSLSNMAKICGIHRITAFYWRHKILNRIQELVNNDILKEKAEIDETLLPLTFEGIKRSTKRGISDEKFNLSCGIDKFGNIHCIASEAGRITSKSLIRIYKGYVEDGTVLVTDSLRSYHQLVDELDVEWKKIPSGKKEIDGYTLESVNGLHSSIKHFLYQYRGIGAKYAQNYISLFIYQWKNGHISNLRNSIRLFNETFWNTKVTRNKVFTSKYNQKAFV